MLRVQGLGFGVGSSGFRVQDSGFRVPGIGYMIQGFELTESVYHVVLKIQFLHKSVNRSFIITKLKNTSSDLCGKTFAQRFDEHFCERRLWGAPRGVGHLSARLPPDCTARGFRGRDADSFLLLDYYPRAWS